MAISGLRRASLPGCHGAALIELLQSLMLDPQLVIAGVRLLATGSGGAIAFQFAALFDAALAAIDPLDGIPTVSQTRSHSVRSQLQGSFSVTLSNPSSA